MPFLPSALFRREPEILFDAPVRVDPQRPVPLFLLIRDAHRFPVLIDEAVVHMAHESGLRRTVQFPYGGLEVREPMWWDSFNIVPERTGCWTLHPCLRVRLNGKPRLVRTDNYPGSTHRPLTVMVAESPLPGAEGWLSGDLHCHTAFTADQIEFGLPLEAAALAGICLGLDWMAATDHSYDLDDREDDYLRTDPDLARWRRLRDTAGLLNGSLDAFTVIPGEEVTCRSRSGRNCHLLAIGAERFIRGSGDGGERGLRTATEHTIAEAAAICAEWGGLACAAHPLEPVSLPERLMLNRGRWGVRDMETPGVSALQIHNGIHDRGLEAGLRAWVKLLLGGRRIVAVGGSDSHGDLNFRRAVNIPFCSIGESEKHRFGTVRTLVYAPSRARHDILEALRSGRAVVSEGPFIDLSVENGNGTARPGDTVLPGRRTVRAEFVSSAEFGSLRNCRILAGSRDSRKERVIPVAGRMKEGKARVVFESRLLLEGVRYLRAEAVTVNGHRCFTNPVWIEG